MTHAFEQKKVDVMAISHYAGNFRSQRVIEKCTRENPLERYQIAGEIRQDLSQKSRGSRRDKRKAFVRHVEKRVWLTEKVTAGL